METTQHIAEIAALQSQAATLRAEYANLDAQLVALDTWTKADSDRLDSINAAAWRLEDRAETLRAELLLATIPGLPLRASQALQSPPAGPDELGSPMVWHNGREYWADEIITLAACMTPAHV